MTKFSTGSCRAIGDSRVPETGREAAELEVPHHLHAHVDSESRHQFRIGGQLHRVVGDMVSRGLSGGRVLVQCALVFARRHATVGGRLSGAFATHARTVKLLKNELVGGRAVRDALYDGACSDGDSVLVSALFDQLLNLAFLLFEKSKHNGPPFESGAPEAAPSAMFLKTCWPTASRTAPARVDHT